MQGWEEAKTVLVANFKADLAIVASASRHVHSGVGGSSTG